MTALDKVRAGLCPWCPRGPFRAVLIHISRAHEMSGREIRDAIGATYTESLTDPDYRQRLADRNREMIASGILPALTREARSRTRSVSKVTKRRRGAILLEGWKSKNRNRRRWLVRAFEAGVPVWDLANREGTTIKVMANYLRRAGCDVPPQTRTRGSDGQTMDHE